MWISSLSLQWMPCLLSYVPIDYWFEDKGQGHRHKMPFHGRKYNFSTIMGQKKFGTHSSWPTLVTSCPTTLPPPSRVLCARWFKQQDSPMIASAEKDRKESWGFKMKFALKKMSFTGCTLFEAFWQIMTNYRLKLCHVSLNMLNTML